MKFSDFEPNKEPYNGPMADIVTAIEMVIQKGPSTDRLYLPKTSFHPNEHQSWCFLKAKSKSFIRRKQYVLKLRNLAVARKKIDSFFESLNGFMAFLLSMAQVKLKSVISKRLG